MGEQPGEDLALGVRIGLHGARKLVDPGAILQELVLGREPLLGARGTPGHDRTGARGVPIQGIAVLVALRDGKAVGEIRPEPPSQGCAQLSRGEIHRVADGADRVIVGECSGAQ
nr:hypothetical protein [Thiocapsa sp. KS1]